MSKQTFTAGQVLTAAEMNSLQENDYNWTVSTKTASYTLAAGDEGTRIVMDSASATTITVDDAIFAAGDVVWIHNIGAGTCTVTAGTATVSTVGDLALAQYAGGHLYFTSASAAIFFPTEQGGGRYVPVTAYTPTYAGFSLGNGTEAFYYAVSGDMMMIEGRIVFGSTTVFGTSSAVYIPPAYKITTYDLGTVITNLCQITYRETGVQDIIAHGKTSNADRILLLNDLANVTYVKEAIANGSTPFTFASGDEIRIRAQFLVAEAP